jgi:acrylyl-CoA reductase (NADPH)
MADNFRALVADQNGDDVTRDLRELSPDDLPEGEVTVRVDWSSVNYKDALAVSPKGRVAKGYPLVPGIDLAGEVLESSDGAVQAGAPVIAHGYDLGVSHHGGFAELARVPANWVVPLPDGLNTREAAAIGTAGFTAAMSVQALEERGLSPDDGQVLVLGATGGVGAVAVAILAERGYDVVASTGKPDEAGWLESLGAGELVSRDETSAESDRPLEKQRWAAVVDPVGGRSLAYALRTLRYGGAVASSGQVGGIKLETTVMPFILRGVGLLGIDSAQVPIDKRRHLWQRLSADMRPRALDEIATRELSLDELDGYLDEALKGAGRGRVLVNVAG